MESTLNTGHQQIHPSDSEQLLGATISNDFTWNEHVAEMLKTLNLRINGLRKVSFAANFKCRKMLANGLVMSKLVYAIQVYGSASEYLIDILQVQQNEAARIVTRLGWTANTKTSLMQVGWLSIRQLVVFHSLLTVFKIHNSGQPRYFGQKFQRRFTYQSRKATGHCYSITQTPHSERIKKSFYYKSIILWNSLPEEVRKIEDFKKFKSKLKLWIQSNMQI